MTIKLSKEYRETCTAYFRAVFENNANFHKFFDEHIVGKKKAKLKYIYPKWHRPRRIGSRANWTSSRARRVVQLVREP